MNTRRTATLAAFCALSLATSSTRIWAQTAPAASAGASSTAVVAPSPTTLSIFSPRPIFDEVKSGAISFDEAFTSRRAKNPDGLVFTVSLGDKAQFHMGEPIPIELRFSSTRLAVLKAEMRNYDRSGRLNGMDDFVISPADGVVDPLADVDFSGIGGGISMIPPVLGPKPAVVSLTLTDYRRFDQPGKYRLFVASNRVFSVGQSGTSIFGSPTTAASEIVEFEVLPFDATWSSQKLSDIVTRLASPSEEVRQGAGSELRVLDTPQAIHEIVARFGEGSTENWHNFHYGLLGSRHRDLVITEMQRQIDSPTGAVSSWLLRDLSTLMFAQTKPAPMPPYVANDKAQVIEYSKVQKQRETALKRINDANWQRLNRAIAQKSGKARALSLQALLELLPSGDKVPVSTSRAVLSTFFDLPAEQQNRLLQSNWSALRVPEALPVLQKSLDSQTAASSDNEQNREWIGLLLTRTWQLSPAAGRQAIVAEIERPHPRAKIEVLGALPDATLPALDDLLAKHLEKSRDFTDGLIHAQLIERYASPRIFSRVRAFYEKLPNGNWPYDAGYALLAYLLRANPNYGMSAIRKITDNPQDSNNYELLPGVAKLHTNDELEKLIVAQLYNAKFTVVSDAATALELSGSASAEAVLWKRLQVFHSGLNGKQPDQQQKIIEEALWKALASMPGPTLQRAKMQQLHDLCTDSWARQQIDEMLKYNDWKKPPEIGFNALSYGGRWFAFRQRLSFSTFEALTRKLSQFPRGTTFSYTDDYASAPQDNAAVRSQLERWLQTRGMKLVRSQQP